MWFHFCLLGLLAPSVIIASPIIATQLPGIIATAECKAVGFVVDVLESSETATAFCSSYLGISTQTFTTSETATVSATDTAFTTATVTVYPTTVTAEALTTITSTCTPVQSATLKKRGGHPVAIPSGLKNFGSEQLSQACECLSIPTPSVTITQVATTTNTATITDTVSVTVSSTFTTTATETSTVPYCPVPTTCANEGLQWAHYSNVWSAPEDLKTETPDYESTTTYVNFDFEYQDSTIYGSSTIWSTYDYWVLDHKGYIYAEISGAYTFQVQNTDDEIYFWIGPNAYSGWTAANADLYSSLGGPGETVTFELVEGNYYPIRIAYGNTGGGPAIEDLSITAPDGTVILGSSTAGSPYVVQYSCDGTTAPQFSAWGSET